MTDLTDNERLRLAQLEKLYAAYNDWRLDGHTRQDLISIDNKKFVTLMDIFRAITAPPSNLVAVDREEWERTEQLALKWIDATRKRQEAEADRDRLREALRMRKGYIRCLDCNVSICDEFDHASSCKHYDTEKDLYSTPTED